MQYIKNPALFLQCLRSLLCMGLIPGPGTPTCHRCSPPKQTKLNIEVNFYLGFKKLLYLYFLKILKLFIQICLRFFFSFLKVFIDLQGYNNFCLYKRVIQLYICTHIHIHSLSDSFHM